MGVLHEMDTFTPARRIDSSCAKCWGVLVHSLSSCFATALQSLHVCPEIWKVNS